MDLIEELKVYDPKQIAWIIEQAIDVRHSKALLYLKLILILDTYHYLSIKDFSTRTIFMGSDAELFEPEIVLTRLRSKKERIKFIPELNATKRLEKSEMSIVNFNEIRFNRLYPGASPAQILVIHDDAGAILSASNLDHNEEVGTNIPGIGRLPLVAYAALIGSNCAFSALLDKGADPKKESSCGWNALHAAIRSSNQVAIQRLTGQVPSAGSLCALIDGFRSIPSDFDANETIGNTPAIHVAIYRRNYAALLQIIKSKVNVNTRDPGSHTPLIRAVSSGDVELTRLLLDHGADPNIAGTTGKVPLHDAAFLVNSLPIIQLLVDNKADVNAKATDGKTPLHLFAQFSNPESVKYLIEHGADPALTDNDGKVPSDFATNEEIITLLANK